MKAAPFTDLGLAPLNKIYAAVRAHSEALAQPLSAEDCAIQSMPDASPVKWHLAHTSWFFETVILSAREGYQAFDPRLAFLFNSYYEALGPRHPRPRRGLLTRPSLDEVLAYRAHVDAAMGSVLEEALNNERLHAAILLGLNHEQQHQELILTDIKHALFANPLLPSYGQESPTPQGPRDLEWQNHPGGICLVGHDGPAFAFDNERPRHRILLQPFRIASRPVSNAEYLAFVTEGGYRHPEFWLSDGWARVQEEGWDAPLYWLIDDDTSADRSVFTLSGVVPLDPHAPVEHVSFYEAAAYAAWAGARLPTEFEWEAAAVTHDGDVWEWTRSSYDPYPGFKPFEGAVSEYNGKFMVGQMVLRGGSSVTPAGHGRPSYRNFFPPQARWQFSGIRLAADA
ncbi:MAG: ergothioneine biosynthesis protein EgtB [Pseudomonadota bacterium]